MVEDSILLSGALIVAGVAFRAAYDKGGKPLILHGLRVMFKVQHLGINVAIAGLLHDVLEDTGINVEDLRSWGIPEESIELIIKLTRKPGQIYNDYIIELAPDVLSRAIKIADLQDNMSPTRALTATKELASLQERYRKAYDYLTSFNWREPPK